MKFLYKYRSIIFKWICTHTSTFWRLNSTTCFGDISMTSTYPVSCVDEIQFDRHVSYLFVNIVFNRASGSLRVAPDPTGILCLLTHLKARLQRYGLQAVSIFFASCNKKTFVYRSVGRSYRSALCIRSRIVCAHSWDLFRYSLSSWWRLF